MNICGILGGQELVESLNLGLRQEKRLIFFKYGYGGIGIHIDLESGGAMCRSSSLTIAHLDCNIGGKNLSVLRSFVVQGQYFVILLSF